MATAKCYQIQLRLTQVDNRMVTVKAICPRILFSKLNADAIVSITRRDELLSKLYSHCNSFRLLVNHVKRVPSKFDLGEFALSNLLAIFPKDQRHWNKGDCNET